MKQKDASGEWATVPMFWTKEKPGKLPQWESYQKGGKTIWDNTAQFDYLISKVAIPYDHKLKDVKFPEFETPAPQQAQHEEEEEDDDPIGHLPSESQAKASVLDDDDDDDLPF